jgi:hypothetical protein
MSTREVAVRRGAGGHWLAGSGSPNPGGRTSALAEVRALLKPHVGLYVDRLNELVRHPDPTVALPALREALDRLLGKAVVAVESDTRTWDMASIQQMYLVAVKASNANANAAPTIDAAPSTATTTLPAGSRGNDTSDSGW